MALSCPSCSKPLARGSKGQKCAPCRRQPKPDKFCGECGRKVCARQNKSGYCRKCLLMRVDDAKRMAALLTAVRAPENRAKLSANQRRFASNPETRARWREAGKRNYHLTLGSEKGRARARDKDTITRRARTRSQKMTGWCPPEHRSDYERLRRDHGAAVARQTIEGRVRAALEAMTPFERMMAKVKAGAGISIKLPMPGRSYDCTLGGVTAEAL